MNRSSISSDRSCFVSVTIVVSPLTTVSYDERTSILLLPAGANTDCFLLNNSSRAVPSGKHGRVQLGHLDDHVGGYIRPPRRGANGFHIGRLIKAISLLLVGTEKGEDPLYALVVIDEFDFGSAILCQLVLLCKIPFDDETWHPSPPTLACWHSLT